MSARLVIPLEVICERKYFKLSFAANDVSVDWIFLYTAKRRSLFQMIRLFGSAKGVFEANPTVSWLGLLYTLAVSAGIDRAIASLTVSLRSSSVRRFAERNLK